MSKYLAKRVMSNRNVVPGWVTSEEGKKEQKQLWDAIAQEFEDAKPGCVKAIL